MATNEEISNKLDVIQDMLNVSLDLRTVDILLGFFEEEVNKSDGRLTHLKEDIKFVEFFDELKGEEDDSEGQGIFD